MVVEQASSLVCQKFANHECTESQSDEECTTKVKCFAERPTHNFGCMAVMMYNASVALDNDTLSNTTPNLKSCWSQDATALQECLDDEKCVANARKTGTKDRGAMFCCCRTHNCNHNFTFRPQEEPTTGTFSTTAGKKANLRMPTCFLEITANPASLERYSFL